MREKFNAASNERDPEPSRGYASESSTFLDFPVSFSSKAVDVARGISGAQPLFPP